MAKTRTVGYDDGETIYRATIGACSLVDSRRFHENQDRLEEWYQARTGFGVNQTPDKEWEKLSYEVRITHNLGQQLGEILAALKRFEVGSADEEGDVSWETAEWPWSDFDTLAEEAPAAFFHQCLELARLYNPGLFYSDPAFLTHRVVNLRR